MTPPSNAVRLWIMIVTGSVFIALAMTELILTTFNLLTTDRPFEEVTALLIFGFTVLWFSTPQQENARTISVPKPQMTDQTLHPQAEVTPDDGSQENSDKPVSV